MEGGSAAGEVMGTSDRFFDDGIAVALGRSALPETAASGAVSTDAIMNAPNGLQDVTVQCCLTLLLGFPPFLM